MTLFKNKFPFKELNTFLFKKLNMLPKKELIILLNKNKSPELNMIWLNTELIDNLYNNKLLINKSLFNKSLLYLHNSFNNL